METELSAVTFRLAGPDDAASLSEFASVVFLETFGPDNTAADSEAYQALAFSPAIQATEIASPGAITVLAMDADRIAGYAYLAPGPPDTVTVEADPIEIKRFYIGSKHHGRGLGRRLMLDVFDRSKSAGARTIWLGVWERNARAIAFYHKLGFTQIGTHPFRLGSDLQTDWVMQNTTALR
ncbi:MAG: GNAT family N-acetyltransferase [Longimicrobiales bacterium]